MGWKPGKYLKKAWKGVKKVVKKIGRGIKKVAKGFMKAIGKLGVVGQLGLMFFMPYAVGALSSMFGNMIGAAGQWLGATAKTLTSGSSFIGKALGHTMNAIHTVGSKIGHVYSTITETISGAINSFADATGLGKGFDAVGKFFHEKIVNPTKQFFGFEASAYQPMFNNPDLSGKAVDGDLVDTKVKTDYDPSKGPDLLADLDDATATGKARVDTKTGQIVDASGKPKVPSIEDQKKSSLLQQAAENKQNPLAQKIQEEAEEGLLSGVRQETRELITGKPPTPTMFGGSQYNFGSTLWTDPNQVSVWNGVFQQDQGNPWMAYNQQFYDQLQNGISNLLQDETYTKEIESARNFVSKGSRGATIF